jgi:GNAT superfamily N-acetyltransferase
MFRRAAPPAHRRPLVLELPDSASPCPRYRLPGVASVHQFAVDPAHQGRGCGQALPAMAERRARELGCREPALDTPTRAAHLLRYDEARGVHRRILMLS